MTQIVVLMNQTTLICKIEEVLADIGQPDCKLISPYVIENGCVSYQWMANLTEEKEFMISSDKILSIFEPNQTTLEEYNSKLQ